MFLLEWLERVEINFTERWEVAKMRERCVDRTGTDGCDVFEVFADVVRDTLFLLIPT